MGAASYQCDYGFDDLPFPKRRTFFHHAESHQADRVEAEVSVRLP